MGKAHSVTQSVDLKRSKKEGGMDFQLLVSLRRKLENISVLKLESWLALFTSMVFQLKQYMWLDQEGDSHAEQKFQLIFN